MIERPHDDALANDTLPVQQLARAGAVAVVMLSAVVFVGWTFNITLLKSVGPQWVAMRPNTALCFALCGVACWLFARESQTPRQLVAARALSITAGAIALGTLAEYVFGWNLHIDALLFHESVLGAAANPRMSPYTAIAFTLHAAGLVSARRAGANALRDLLVALPVLMVGMLSMIGYAFGSPAQANFFGFTGVALPTAVGHLVLGGTVLALRGDAGPLGIFNNRSSGGALARRLLPLVVVVPVALAWLRLQGERGGLYDTEFGLALHTVANVTVLAFLVWLSARSLAATDAARRETAGKLSSTENRNRALIEHGREGVTLIGRDGTILYRSPSVPRLFGRKPTATKFSESLATRIHPDDVESHRLLFERVVRAPELSEQAEVRHMHGDGEWHWFEVIYTNMLDDPDIGAVVANFHDITERKASERALRESEERFREIAGHINEAFFSIDLKTRRTLYISPTWAEIWGRPVEEAYAKPMLWFESIHPEDRAGVMAGQAAAAKGTPSNDVFRVIRPDGTMRWVRGRAFPVRDANGEINRLVGVSEDITELRRTEEQFMQAQKMEAVGRLAGGVAHDFNNLLTVILAEADLAKAELPPDSPMIGVLGDIRKSSERAAVLTRQLLAFSRKQLVEPVVFDVNDAVTDTAKLLRRLIGEDVRVELRLARKAGSIRADRGQFEQVLTNLAVNARDAMPSGGMLSIETSIGTLDEEYANSRAEVRAGEYAVVIVSDTGTGMTPAVQARVFEPFFTTKEQGRGTGLGLATCYGIVKQAGGHISIYSEVGVGTTFRVYFPLVAAGAVAAEAADQQAPPRGTETVLLVEDEEAVRRVGARILRAQGYTVIEARDALEALKMLAAHSESIGLLLTDVVLPVMGGRELADRVRDVQPGVKVLFATGYTDDVILQHQLLSHDVVILQKPYTRVTMAQKVREVLDG